MTGYDPELYRAVHRGTPGDLMFYGRACEGARSVLELGCGYGRVLAHLASGDRTLVGLDLDPGLLELAREALGEQAELIEGDMTRFELGRRFDRVLIPHSGLWCLPDDDAVVGCFDSARRHLAPGGLLVLDAWAADLFHAEGEPAAFGTGALDRVVTVELTARGTFDVWERVEWDRDGQRIDATYVHVPRDGGAAVEGVIRHRYLLRPQLEELLRRGGLAVARLEGGFGGEAYSPEAELLVCVARPRTVT